MFAELPGDNPLKASSSFQPYSKRTIMGRKDRIQLAVSSPVFKVTFKSTKFLKYLQKFQVCVYGEDTKMFEIREYQATWYSTGINLHLIGMKTIVHSCRNKD